MRALCATPPPPLFCVAARTRNDRFFFFSFSATAEQRQEEIRAGAGAQWARRCGVARRALSPLVQDTNGAREGRRSGETRVLLGEKNNAGAEVGSCH